MNLKSRKKLLFFASILILSSISSFYFISPTTLYRVLYPNFDFYSPPLVTGLDRKYSPINSVKFADSTSIQILIIFTKSNGNEGAKFRFRQTTLSILRKSSLPVVLHVVADNATKIIADQILTEAISKTFRTHFYAMDRLGEEISRRLGNDLFQFFRFSPDSYYGDALFFLSLVMADLFPRLERVIKIDSDLQFRADIAELWAYFHRFSSDQLFGFAREQQPVYRHVFNTYRFSMNSSTKVGDPPPDGVTGFNSGVILLDLDKIRKSNFRSLIRLENIRRLVEKYRFRGHLGDQDLYTLLSIENPELFYILPCQWNRQLCQWWRDHGYADVFDEYFQCSGPIKIYHGNCQTDFPKDGFEKLL